MGNNDTLDAEARRIGRYLVGGDLPDEMIERYREANRCLFPDTPSPEDGALLDFVRRQAWSLPLLESALGLIRPEALLRRKLVVLMAILETEPRFAGHFEAVAPGRTYAVLRLLGLGISSVFKVLGGLLLYPFARLLGSRESAAQDRPGS